MRKPILYALAAIAVLGSCTGNNNPVMPVEAPVFTATIAGEDGAASGPQHAVVVPNGETKMKVNWESGDTVGMDFYTRNEMPRPKTYVATPAANPTQTTLTLASGQFEADIYYLDQACYPASLWTNGFPDVQTYQGADQVSSAPMYYKNTTPTATPLPTSLTFYNAAALLRITVCNSSSAARTVQSVSVESNKKMNGAAGFEGNALKIMNESTGTNILTLNCVDDSNNGVSISAGGSSVFYIIVPPTTYRQLTFTVTYTEGAPTVKQTTTNENITIARNKVYPISM